MLISSVQNPRVKAVAKLWSSGSERRATGMFVMEGEREISRALTCKYEVCEVFFQPELLTEEGKEVVDLLSDAGGTMYEVTQPVYDKLAVREQKDGLVVVLKMKSHTLNDLTLKERPLILAAYDVENPGNVGALLRTADGAGVDAVCLIDYNGDVYNPHAIRASIGTVFSVPIALCDGASFMSFCTDRAIRTYGAALHKKACPAFNEEYTGASAFVLGNEANGLPEEMMDACDALIQIPMNGIADSLNVSIAGAILMYEAFRQRNSAE